MDEGDTPRAGGTPSAGSSSAGGPPDSGSESAAEGSGGNSVRRISWILGAAIVLFGAAYFLGDLRPERMEGEESGAVAGPMEESAEPAAIDTLITPDDLPGFETADLTNAQRLWLYHRAHREECGCGCGMTVAQCRVEDPTCPESPGRAVELVQEAREAVPGGN